MLLSSTSARVLSLWNGSGNDSPPAGWELAAFDDSAWAAAVVATTEPGETRPAGSSPISAGAAPASATEQVLVRQHFSVPDTTTRIATTTVLACDAVGLLGCY